MAHNILTYRQPNRVRSGITVVLIAGSVLFLLIPGISHAAPSPPALPGSADPGRIFQDISPVPEPSTPAPSAIAPLPEAPAPQGDDTTRFLVQSITIEGSTVYDQNAFIPLYAPYIGQQITLRTLYEIAGAVTKRYHDDGYSLTQAILPPQDITDGAVKIQVIEGYIDDIELQGEYRDSSVAQNIIERIWGYRPLNAKDLERDILLLNDLPGVSVQAVLEPPSMGSPPGAHGLALIFSDQPYPNSVSADNLGSRYVGPYQFSFATGINHLIMPYQQTSLYALETSPANNLKFLSASHTVPIDSFGTTFTLQGSYSHSDPGYKLTPEEISSDSWNYGVSVAHPLIRSRLQTLTVSGDFTLQNIMTNALGSELYHDKLTIAGLSASYDRSDSWGGSNLAQVKLSQGLNMLGETPTGSPDLSRADGHSDFTKVTGNAGRLQAIADRMGIYIAVEGQYAWTPLLSSQQFGFGGQQFGRGYDASEITGDDGVAGSAELRYALLPFLPKATSELFAFYDIGRVWNYGDYDHGTSAESAGCGMRFAFNPLLSGTLTLAKPLTLKDDAPPDGNGKNPRGYFSLIARF